MRKQPRSNTEPKGKVVKESWAIDKRINLATGINLVQLVAVIWFGASFYTQVNANQLRNDERFAEFSEARKTQNQQMLKLQEAQNELLVKISTISERMSSQADVVKDIRDILTRPNGDLRRNQ